MVVTSNVTTINTNTFITNVNTTIYNTNVYQTFVSSTNYYESVTNIYNKAVSYHTNSTIVLSNSYITINGTNVATVNETDGYVPYRLSSTNFTDSYFYRVANGMGTDTNLYFGPGVTNLFFRNPSNILVYSNGIPVMQALDSGGRTLEWGVQSTIPFVSGTGALELFGGTGSGLTFDSGAHAIYPTTGGVGEDLGTATKYYGSLYLTNQIVFGPGTTNVLYRSGSDTFLTNSGTAPAFYVLNGSGTGAKLSGSSGGGRAMLEASGLAAAGLGVVGNSDAVAFQGTYFLPLRNDTTSLAGPGASDWWHNAGLEGTLFISGYRDILDSANYSRLAISHTGTNGVILLSSQAAGIAGAPRPFQIDRNLGATLAVGDTTYVDMFQASATNAVSGALTFEYATNGLDLVEFTHVRTLYNGSGSDQTINLPSGWHKGVGAGSSFVVTNATLAKLYVTSTGPTSSAGLQTNVTATVSFFP